MLQLGPPLRRDERVGQRPEAGGDAVDRAGRRARCRPRWTRLVAIAVDGVRRRASTWASPRATASDVGGGDPGGLDDDGRHVRHSVVQNLAGPGARPAGRPGAGTTGASRMTRSARAPRPQVRRRRRGAGPARRPRSPPRPPRPGVIRISRTASAMQNGIDEVYDEPGLQSVASATVDAGVEQPAGVRVGRAGGELGARAAAWPPCAEPASASTSASVRWVQWSALAAPSSTASCTPRPGAELVGVHPRAAARRAMPAVRIARAWSTSKAPRSQNTSIQRAYGAAAASIAPADQLHVVVRVGRRTRRARRARRGRWSRR